MADDVGREQDNARRLSLARASGQRQQQRPNSSNQAISTAKRMAGGLSKLTPSGVGGAVGKKVAQKVFGGGRVSKGVGWIIGSVGCGCLIAIVFALLPILFIVVLGCGPLKLC